MSVTPSPIGGFAAQFFDNNGVILSGGKIYTYAAGTTTPQATYTSASGATPHANPIILDSAGRVPGGETWLTDGLVYKFTLETSTGILLGTYDNVDARNAASATSLVPSGYTTATNVQTAFDNLGSSAGSSKVGFLQAGTGAVSRTSQAKMRDFLSVKDFGAVGDGVTDDTTALTAMVTAVNAVTLTNAPVGVYFPQGKYRYSATLGFNRPVSLFADCDATLDYTGNSFAIRLGPTNLLNSPSAFSYQEMTVDGLRFTGGANAVHGIYISDSIFEPRIRNCVFDDFGSPTGGSVYCIWGQANNWNTLIENCRMFVQNRPSASGVNFIAINGISENGVSDGGNSRVTIRDCWMTAYNPGNFLGAFALINATASRIVGGGFQWSSRGILLNVSSNDVTIDGVYCEIYTNDSSFIEHISSGSGATYQSPQYINVQNCYVNFHASDGVTNARAVRPFDATAQIVGWSIDNLTVSNIAAGQIIVEQNNLTGQVGNNFSNVNTLFVPRGTDTGAIRPNFPQVLSNVDSWGCSDGRGIREVGASFTLTREDANRVIICSGGSMVITVPPTGADQYIPVGSVVQLRNVTGGNQTISPGAGVSLVMLTGGPTRTLVSNGFATLTCTKANEWNVTGLGVS
jgi:hypothetical protein